MRVAGLKIFGQLLSLEALSSEEIVQDLVLWVANALKINGATHYLDGVKGCGQQLEE